MTVERYLQGSAGDKGRKPPKNGVDKTKVMLQAQQQQWAVDAVEGSWQIQQAEQGSPLTISSSQVRPTGPVTWPFPSSAVSGMPTDSVVAGR